MPFVDHIKRDEFRLSPAATPATPAPPTWGETSEAAFRLENDIVNAIELMNKPAFTWDDNFNVREYLQERDRVQGTMIWEQYKENFLTVGSREHADWVLQKIATEQRQMDVIQRSGAAGLAMAIGAGVLSPTMFMPLMGPLKGAKGVGSAAVLAGTAGALQEIPLQMNQETRTMGESAFAIGASTIVGGLLGGAVVALRPGERELIEQGMARPYGGPAISGSLNAAENQRFGTGGRLAKGARSTAKVLNSNPVTRNPVLDTIEGSSPAARERMQALSDAGLRYEGNESGIATVAGGTVENRLTYSYSLFGKAVKGSDEAYQEYVFAGGKVPGMLPNVQASIAARRTGMLSKREFLEEVATASRQGDVHPNPYVAKAAKAWRAELFDPLVKMAEEVGLFRRGDLGDDISWLWRMYDSQAIRAAPQEFIDIIRKDVEEKLTSAWAADVAKTQNKLAVRQELLEDLKRPAAEVKTLRKQFEEALKEVTDSMDLEIATAIDEAAYLRQHARDVMKMTEMPEPERRLLRRQYLDDAKAQENLLGVKETKAHRAELRRRLRNLSKTRIALEEKQAGIIERLMQLEQDAIDSIDSIVRQGHKMLKEIEGPDGELLADELSRLRTLFAQTGEKFDRIERRLSVLGRSKDPQTEKLLAAEDKFENMKDRMMLVSEQLRTVEEMTPVEARAVIWDALEMANKHMAELLLRQGRRAGRLEAQVKRLDPAQVAERMSEVQTSITRTMDSFAEKWKGRGATGVDFDSVDFAQYAEDFATQFKDRVIGTNVRIPAFDTLVEKRGTELARLLNIDSRKLSKFLVNDMEQIGRTYTRTVGPDIELMRRFETLDVGEIWKPVGEEMNRRLARIAETDHLKPSERARLTPEQAQALQEKRVAKASQALDKEYRRHQQNFTAVWGRLRGTWGLPKDPEGLAFRLGHTVGQANMTRMMGRVVIASVADVQRPIQRHGLTNVFGSAFIPMITNWKAVRLAAAEARLLQGALDPVLQSRGRAMFDIMDDLQRGTKFERAMDKITGRFGLIALFDQWNGVMKQYAGIVAIARVLNSVDTVVNGGSKRAVQKATTFLAESGYTPDDIQRTWRMVQKEGGASKHGGLWLPNTEVWDDVQAKRLLYATIHREADIMIVTPGVDKPLWTDVNQGGRLLAQFKSFGFASTQKMIMAGLQQRDMAFVTGTILSLGLGALSYYLWGCVAGGDAYKQMMNADAAKWADEAIDRSGMLGILSEVRRIGETIPYVTPYVTFSGQRTSRRAGDDLIGALLGPTGDFVEKAANVVTGIHDPTRSTGHALRTLMPFQNTPIFSHAYDQIEQSVNLKERRSK